MQTHLNSLQLRQEQFGLVSDRKLTERERAARKIQASIGDLQSIQREADITQGQTLLRQESAIHESTAQVLAAQQRLEIKLNDIEAATVGKVVRDIASSIRQPTLGTESLEHRSISVSASIMQSKCSNRCVCACHRRSNIRTPRLLHRIFGALFIGYTGIPRITPSCDTRGCIQRSSPTVLVTYFFPMWFLAWAVSLVMRLSTYNGPQFSLAVSRIVSSTSVIFEYAVRGNLDDLKMVLGHRIASPRDIGYPNGYSALMVTSVRSVGCSDKIFNPI